MALDAQVASGLVPPAVAYHLFGKGGVILITIMVFMAGEHYHSLPVCDLQAPCLLLFVALQPVMQCVCHILVVCKVMTAWNAVPVYWLACLHGACMLELKDAA